MPNSRAVVRVGAVQQRILLIRGERVIVDTDLAEFYGVTTKALNQAVRRNKRRFPRDFVFQLTKSEKEGVLAVCEHLERLKYSPSNPYAFTEYGAIMAAAVLNSQRAVDTSVFIVRAFVALRRAISEHKEMSTRMAQIENRLTEHDRHIVVLARALNELSTPQKELDKKTIGF